jgi:hypothetical protein
MNKELRSDDDQTEAVSELNYVCINQSAADGNYGVIFNEFQFRVTCDSGAQYLKMLAGSIALGYTAWGL